MTLQYHNKCYIKKIIKKVYLIVATDIVIGSDDRMEKNVGEVNAGVRIIIGIFLFMGLGLPPLWKYFLLIAISSTYLCITAVTQYCPLCELLHIDILSKLPNN